MSRPQPHQRAETAEYLQGSQQERTIQPEETDQAHSGHGSAQNDNPRPGQPRSTGQIHFVEVMDEDSVLLDRLNLAMAIRLAWGDFELDGDSESDISAVIELQARLFQDANRRLIQRLEQGSVVIGDSPHPNTVNVNATVVAQVEQNPSVTRAARGPFGIVRETSPEDVAITNLPFRPRDEKVMKDVSGNLVLKRPGRP
ncbi:uncharacterized protein Z520_00215 [Fonsecaea multimorphosa CBS 102226]|uniref:Uncharacterized protein n=1 Tax=Fonsecaea multimorphosa CBS 102226 TaxID=1442371 RepID=A0A0D2L389_9EURO|nr:uncharacterized protein Z520_00215 [Fonsecaea multimorphosa CBS 102226]KIY03524.1 hypothetical protein Z520_00215 [Fonsecaea multimorphosa CBS 102226]OAL32639.1 hypothetical protein AYO22_00252 [Fonsecaea multimorphosa]